MPEEIASRIDIVDVFRPSEEVMGIVEEAIRFKEKHGRPYVIWLQLGIGDEKAEELAKQNGIEVVANRCIMVEHGNLSQ